MKSLYRTQCGPRFFYRESERIEEAAYWIAKKYADECYNDDGIVIHCNLLYIGDEYSEFEAKVGFLRDIAFTFHTWRFVVHKINK